MRKKTYHGLSHIDADNSEFTQVANLFKQRLGCKTSLLLLTEEAKSNFRNPGWEGEQHARQLLLEFEGGTGLVMFFDLGMSWARTEESVSYQGSSELPLFDHKRNYISSRSYVLVTTELTDYDRDLWTLTSAVPEHFAQRIEAGRRTVLI